jgi:hypothetical protein
MTPSSVEEIYTNGAYLHKNPDWHRSDSSWKASLVQSILTKANLSPASICEVGCGAGDVVVQLKKRRPEVKVWGYDISPDAARFWKEHDSVGIQFHCEDFLLGNTLHFDCIMLLDVVEHLADPLTFLSTISTSADYFLLHFPLDLSALSVLRERPLLRARQNAGHVHYFTKGLALSLLRESGLDVVDWFYTNSSISGPRWRLRTWLASLPRRMAYFLNKDLGVLLLGGETLMVLAKAGQNQNPSGPGDRTIS